ncbi:hypothetical protein [Pseudomonas costantinii]|uniref:FtsK gamma domain-containing protein n=1 Tax=Pseudomonas costantinii TaxID=168469 RepID=A0A1H4TZW0_9PSED|nr:hypothetical protein [Pseudomonas costantinii]SEC61989.1 hypothetical protein SAMN04515675_0006 [Pseudomonas costantinii]
MRRFGVGLQRARWLLVALEEKGVVRGHWGRLVARGELDGREVLSFRVYRVPVLGLGESAKGVCLMAAKKAKAPEGLTLERFAGAGGARAQTGGGD